MEKIRNLLGINWKKGLLGLAAAALVLVICFPDAPKKSLLLAAVCVAAGFLKLNIRSQRWRFALGAGIALVCMVRIFEMTTVFMGMIGFSMSLKEEVFWDFPVYLYNVVCIAVVILAVFLICGKWRLSVALGSFAMAVLGLVNGFVYQFRGRELMYVDLYSAGTAMNVAGQYSFDMSPVMWFHIGIWTALILLLFAIPGTEKKRGIKPRLAVLSALCLLVLALDLGNLDRPCWSWENRGSYMNGYYLNFYLGFRDSFVSAPKGYSSDAVARMEEDYPDGAEDGKQLPNILVIMNESFADLRYLDSELQTNIPVMPFFDSLEENTIRGWAVSSIFGGNTANSEFEFLTGCSMAYLPDGTVPYQFYIEEELFSLPWLLRSYGYDTFATHPYRSSGWNRTVAYPLLGFEDYSFEEDYPGVQRIRKFISDREMYDYILEKLDAQGDAPLFLFGITMQNHGSYDYQGDNFRQTVRLEDRDSYPMVEQYLSLINYSDKALEELLTALEDGPRDTVVLFFGDHLPAIEPEFYEDAEEGMDGTLATHIRRYTVPFVIWANYDIPEQTVECTSLNYLGRYLLEAAGLELPGYYRFLSELEETVPAVSALGYYSPSAGTWLTLEEARGEEAAWLERYAYLQHNGMFDPEGRSDYFFGKYFDGP